MLIIISQIVVLAIMAILFAIEFKKDKSKFTTKELTMVAMLCVLTAVVARVLAIKLPPGQPMFIISLAAVLTTTIGLLVSPKMALFTGIVIDVLGLLMSAATGDGSMPFLGFTLSSMLSVYLPSILSRSMKDISPRKISIAVYAFLIVMLGLGFVFINNAESISLDGVRNDLDPRMRTLFIALLMIMATAIAIANIYYNYKFKNERSKQIISPSHLTFIILITEIVCSVLGTSLWLYIMYGVNFEVAMMTRIVRVIIQLPINVGLTYLLIKYLPYSIKSMFMQK